MSKPILFETITRARYNALSEEDKKKKNYQIKEEDGTITKVIPGLEGGDTPSPTPTGGIFTLSIKYDEGEPIPENIQGALSNLFSADYTWVSRQIEQEPDDLITAFDSNSLIVATINQGGGMYYTTSMDMQLKADDPAPSAGQKIAYGSFEFMDAKVCIAIFAGPLEEGESENNAIVCFGEAAAG